MFVRAFLTSETRLVSANTNGVPSNQPSRDPVLTPDGRYVAFVSEANDLVAGDTNGIADVFVRDLLTGTTTLASVGAVTTNASTMAGSSEAPQITPDGRYVAFFSTATNLVVGVRTTAEIYVRDLGSGTTTWASTNARAIYQTVSGPTNVFCCNQRISDDGQFVAFTVGTNSPTAKSARAVVLRFNRLTGGTDIIHTNANAALLTFTDSQSLDLTPDGQKIAFAANVGNASGTNTAIYLWDAQTGTNTLISRDRGSGLPAAGLCHAPVLSPDGRFVAFLSNSTNLTPNLLTGEMHLYLRDVQSGLTTLVDASTNGVGVGVNPVATLSLSTNGQWFAFESDQAGLAWNDRNHGYDVFVRTVAAATNELVSVSHPALTGLGPTLSWLAEPGTNYHVQFQTELGSGPWQNILGSGAILGKRGYATDLAPPQPWKFYRAVSP